MGYAHNLFKLMLKHQTLPILPPLLYSFAVNLYVIIGFEDINLVGHWLQVFPLCVWAVSLYIVNDLNELLYMYTLVPMSKSFFC